MQRQDNLAIELQQQILEQICQQYSDTAIDHWMRPRGPRMMSNPDGHARIKGPCGDTMEIFIRVVEETIVDASFMADGCMTTVVSASMAVELATNTEVHKAITISEDEILASLGGLPESSHHCVLLAANTLRAAVADYLKTMSEPWRRASQPD